MKLRGFWCDEYEGGYDSEYGGVYDQNFVFYDEEEVDDDSDDEFEEYDEYEEYDSDLDDVILEEIPFVYCPTKGETGEA